MLELQKWLQHCRSPKEGVWGERQQFRKMGFVRCAIFHIPMNSESLENTGIFTLQRWGKHSGSGALFIAGKVRDLGLDFQEGVE